jgi:hypothetical protein
MVQISMPPIPMKMYRHFAVVTLLLTGTLAMLAEGHHRNLAEPATPESAVVSTPTPTNTPAYGQAQIANRASGSGNFGEEARPGGSYGRGTGSGGVGGNYGFLRPSDAPAANSENAGFTAAYLDSLTEEELDALLQGLRDAGIESEADMRQAKAVLEAGSRRRSGHTQGVG